MDDNITLNIMLSRTNAAKLLETLNRRVESLQGEAKDAGPDAAAAAQQEKEAIIAILMALEAAVKTRRDAGTRAMKPIIELLSQKTTQLPSLEAAEQEARRSLAQASESLAQAHAAFAASFSSQGETAPSAASAAIDAGELELQRAQAAHEKAGEQVGEAKAQEAEASRKAAYALSQRSHDDALAALRQYEPLALEMLKLFSVLTMHADLALADVEAADKARINPHTATAVRHLRSALEEHKQSHAEAAAKHIAEALHQLELAAA
jgi:hypothetical protein